jgi:hypothetical protein
MKLHEGIWEGNSYPETIRSSTRSLPPQTQACPIPAENLIGITASPQMLINSTTDKRFFKVVAFDTE